MNFKFKFYESFFLLRNQTAAAGDTKWRVVAKDELFVK
jgi:hypothetical protein